MSVLYGFLWALASLLVLVGGGSLLLITSFNELVTAEEEELLEAAASEPCPDSAAYLGMQAADASANILESQKFKAISWAALGLGALLFVALICRRLF